MSVSPPPLCGTDHTGTREGPEEVAPELRDATHDASIGNRLAGGLDNPDDEEVPMPETEGFKLIKSQSSKGLKHF